jgi:hypothetical protein
VALVALVLALALPKHGVLVVGRSLGGVQLGMNATEVRRVWGTQFARCRSCRRTTWYFNYRKFHPEGAAVEFARGRVSAVTTLWSPPGWKTRDGRLRLGTNAAFVNERYGALVTIGCGTYSTLILTRRDVTTSFYVYNGKLWGFGLQRPGASPCR